MAHGGQDAVSEPPVVGVLGQPERLEKVPLRQTVTAGVVGHPTGQERCLRHGGDQGAANLLGIPTAQERRHFGAEVLNGRPPRVVAAESVVQSGAHVHGGPDGGYVTETDAHAVSALPGLGGTGAGRMP